ncbi:MAG: ATP-binding protein, partial [Pseudomonadota bacterium]
MTDITEVFAGRGRAWLRLPGWRRLVLSMSALGAALILGATYTIVTVRETENARTAALAGAETIAAVVAEEIGQLAPLARALALLSGDALARPGTGPRAAAESAFVRLADAVPGGEPVVPLARLLILPPEEGRAGGGRGAPPRALVARARVAGVATGVGGQTPGPTFWLLWRLGPPGSAVAAVPIRSAALDYAWSSTPGDVAIADAGGLIQLTSVPGAYGAPAADWVTADAPRGALARRSILASATVGTGPLTVHVFRPRRLIAERVGSVLSAQIMIMSLLATLAFFMDSQRSQRAYSDLSQDAAALKALNRRLSDEIAERQRVEAALAQASKLAALGQMSAAVAHELNQPLSAMSTYLASARHLADQGRVAEAAEPLGRIERLIGRMGSLTRDLKAFARPDRPVQRPANLAAAVRHAAEITQPRADACGATIKLALPSRAVPVASAAHLLEQIVVNLLQNAVDAASAVPPDRRSVTVTLSTEGETAVLTVRDLGPGLPVEGDLFAPFFTTKPPGEGLGLGLAIASGIAKDLGGALGG